MKNICQKLADLLFERFEQVENASNLMDNTIKKTEVVAFDAWAEFREKMKKEDAIRSEKDIDKAIWAINLLWYKKYSDLKNMPQDKMQTFKTLNWVQDIDQANSIILVVSISNRTLKKPVEWDVLLADWKFSPDFISKLSEKTWPTGNKLSESFTWKKILVLPYDLQK